MRLLSKPGAFRGLPAAAGTLLLASCFAAAAGAEPAGEPAISREPPALYRKSIAPLLTAADTLSPADLSPADLPPAGLLIDETVHYLSAQGAVYRAEHRVARGNLPAELSFLAGTQQVHLALARSRRGGGAWQEDAELSLAAPDAAGVARLLVSFPGQGPDDLAETVLLVEESLPPLPGELTALLTFYGDPPAARSRSVVELPAQLAERLTDTPVGAAPPKRRLDLGNGRVRFEWLLEKPPPGKAAAVWLTSLDSWDRLADWYRGQLMGRDELPAGLAAAAAAATAAAASPAETATILYRLVADRIATLPSALGRTPALPRRPEEVWTSGRGDGLDQAHLLQALLASRGIPSTLAFVNSRGPGAIETRSPDFRHFDRALLAIALPGAEGRGLLWADPAQPFLELGQLGEGAGRRPAFLIPAAGGWRFATTPAARAAAVSPAQAADLARRADPRLAAAAEAALASGENRNAAAELGEQVLLLDRAGEEGAAGRLYLALEQLAPRRTDLQPVLFGLRSYFESKAAVGVHAGIARRLALVFATDPPAWWAATPLTPAAGAEEAERRLEELEAARQIAPFLRQAVQLLTTYNPRPDFSRRLYQIAYTFAEHHPAAPQVEKLLELMAELPKSDPNFWEGRAIAGRRLAAAGNSEAALALYRELLADPALPPAFRSVYTTLAGQAQLAGGRLEEAGAQLARLEDGADLSLPIVADGLLQGALLELEQGRSEAALGYLRRLLAVEDQVLERSASPRQAASLRRLARDENAARRAWSSAAGWWAHWLELEAAWLAENPAAAPPAPLLGDLEQLGAEFGARLERGAGDPGEEAAALAILRRLARAARWDPSLALELSGSLVYLAAARPALAPAIHRTAALLHASLPPFGDPADAERARLLLAAHRLEGGSDRLAEAFAAWRRRFALPIFELAEPAALDDPRLAGRPDEELIADRLGGSWLAPENVKIAFLLAADSGRPAAVRAAALIAALPELRGCVPRQGRYREMLLALAGEPRFPAALRGSAAFWLAYSLLQHENLAAADEFLARPDLELAAAQREALAALRALPASKPASAGERAPAALESYLAALLDRPLDPVEAQLFPEAWRYLALAGEPGAAGRLAGRLADLAIAGGGAAEAEQLRREALASLDGLDRIRRSIPLWRAAATGSASPNRRARPALADEIASPETLEGLLPADCRELLLYDLETFALGLAATPRWPAAFAACQDGNDAGRRQRDLALAVFRSPLADPVKARALFETASQIADDDQVWPSLLAALAPPAGEPLTGKAAGLLAARQAQRDGQPVDWASLEAGLPPDLLPLVHGWRADGILGRRDAAGAAALLASMSPGELASPIGMSQRLRLLELTPFPRREAVRAAARRQIYTAELAALALSSWSEGRRAIGLSLQLDGEASYPRAFYDALLAGAAHPLGRLSLQLADAEARRDWPAAYAAAQAMLAAQGEDHDDLFRLGRAAFEAGKKEEAQIALRLFLEKTRNHPDEGAARLLLARLGAP